ncbi:MAG: hypothetical protein KDI66_21715, partial [Xanthomonadales bacterium]|nr:hypothetical protein [Xanthomonadales bacterium]
MRLTLLSYQWRFAAALLLMFGLAMPAIAQVIAPGQVLDIPTPPPLEQRFGQSVSSDGQYLAVGAPFYGGGTGGTSP